MRKPRRGKRKRRLARGASDFEQIVSGFYSCGADQVVEQRLWIIGPGAMVGVGGRSERAPQAFTANPAVRVLF